MLKTLSSSFFCIAHWARVSYRTAEPAGACTQLKEHSCVSGRKTHVIGLVFQHGAEIGETGVSKPEGDVAGRLTRRDHQKTLAADPGTSSCWQF